MIGLAETGTMTPTTAAAAGAAARALQFKLGDQVRIRRLDKGSNGEMLRYVGRCGYVESVRSNAEGKVVVKLRLEDGELRVWYLESLEAVTPL